MSDLKLSDLRVLEDHSNYNAPTDFRYRRVSGEDLAEVLTWLEPFIIGRLEEVAGASQRKRQLWLRRVIEAVRKI